MPLKEIIYTFLKIISMFDGREEVLVSLDDDNEYQRIDGILLSKAIVDNKEVVALKFNLKKNEQNVESEKAN